MVQHPSTRIVHTDSGAPSRPGEAIAPAIHTSTIYTNAGDVDGVPFNYGRQGNPTWSELEGALGRLEDASATVFASGQAATFALMMSLTAERARVLLPSDGYHGTRDLARRLARCGVEPVVLDLADLGLVEDELKAGSGVLWVETPTNPFLRVFDLGALGKLARRAGAPMVVDNTTATAALQRPLELGATAVVTSLSKSSSGHSDVILGAVTTRDEALLEEVRRWRTSAGGIAGPFEAWMALRGLRTLPLRIARQSENAAAIAAFLARQPLVRRVHYPGLDPATRDLASRQMPSGFGPLLSFEVDGDRERAQRVVAASRLVRAATSFGGVETCWERRARWPAEHAPENLIRLSAGIEALADVLADIEQSLAAAAS